MLKEEAGSSVCLSVRWLTFLTRQLQRGRNVETRSEVDDETEIYKQI